jgi:hypothetical protein
MAPASCRSITPGDAKRFERRDRNAVSDERATQLQEGNRFDDDDDDVERWERQTPLPGLFKKE